MWPALVTDLPGACEIDVSPTLHNRIAKYREWALLSLGEQTMPIRLRVRDVKEGRIRTTMLTRTLLHGGRIEKEGIAETGQSSGVKEARAVLSALFHDLIPFSVTVRNEIATHGWWRGIWAVGRYYCRRIVNLAERCLRLLFWAPEITLGVTEPVIGDDTNRVARLPQHSFPLLGIKPGDQVLVSWADRQAIAIALEAYQARDVGEDLLAQSRQVDVILTEAFDQGTPESLCVGVTAELRLDLGIPRETIVTVRRRLVPLFIGRLNELTIPVGALVLAAAAVEGLKEHWFGILFGYLIVLGLALSPLRHRGAPNGRYPY
jgi:hypothetical protein